MGRKRKNASINETNGMIADAQPVVEVVRRVNDRVPVIRGMGDDECINCYEVGRYRTPCCRKAICSVCIHYLSTLSSCITCGRKNTYNDIDVSI